MTFFPMMKSRRKALKEIGAITLGTSLLPSMAFSSHSENIRGKVVITGAHPDDPETGCGGTVLSLREQGYDIVLYYLTRGEAGINGKTHQEASYTRVKEAENACHILGAKARFFGQIDGETIVNNEWYKNVFMAIMREDPDLIITHWPIDAHKDHRACSILTYNAWLRVDRKPAFYYYEVMSGEQTQNFHPTDYSDITSFAETKRKACDMHESQYVNDWYDNTHGKMELFRGIEKGCERAEAFVRHSQSTVFVFNS